MGECRLFILPICLFGTFRQMLTTFHLPRLIFSMLKCPFEGQNTMLAADAHAGDSGNGLYHYVGAILFAAAAPHR